MQRSRVVCLFVAVVRRPSLLGEIYSSWLAFKITDTTGKFGLCEEEERGGDEVSPPVKFCFPRPCTRDHDQVRSADTMEDGSNAVMDAAVVVEFPDSLCRSIHLSGFARTEPELVVRELMAAEVHEMESIEEVYMALERAHDALMSLGAYNAVDVLLDEDEVDGRLVAKVQAAEKNTFGLQAGTFVQGDQGTIEASGHVRNVLGRCETIAATVEQGLANNTYSACVTVPRVLQRPWDLDVKASQVFTSNAKWASYVERLRSVSWSLSSEDGTRSLGYELGWRQLSDPSMSASPSIVAHLGESIKSAVRCTFASNGVVASLEVGGLADYCKMSIGGGVAIELSDTVDLVLEGSTGAIVGSAGPPDKLHLGGIVPWGSMRGYQSCGVGPTDKRRRKGGLSATARTGRPRDALGGNFLYSLFGALRFDVPSPVMRALGMRGQIFLQAGANEERIKDVARRAAWRTSAGIGVVLPTALGMLEVNACAALVHQDTDFKTGFQFGLTPSM